MRRDSVTGNDADADPPASFFSVGLRGGAPG